MIQANPVPEPIRDAATASLDCERLDCYGVALEFQVLAAAIGRRARLGTLRDQLDRASVSIVLNIAEGAAARRARTRPASSRSRAAARRSPRR